MKVRAILVGLLLSVAACKSTPGKLAVDSPALPFQPADADELAGVEPADDDAEPAEAEGTEPAPAPSPAPAPATPPAKK
jgi:hypothetical protein